MSPIPPNKEIHDKKNDELINDNPNNEAPDVYEEARAAPGEYVPLSQDVNYSYRSVQNANDENDSESSSTDDEQDNYCQIDPDAEFEMLASSRVDAIIPHRNNKPDLSSNYHLTEVDVFQRKNLLEPEEIQIDETKSKTINNLMSNFKLPDSSIPEWAKTLSEEKWKKNLLDSLNAKKTDLFNNEIS